MSRRGTDKRVGGTRLYGAPDSGAFFYSQTGKLTDNISAVVERSPFLALYFLFVIIVPLLSYDESKVSIIQTTRSAQLPLTVNNKPHFLGIQNLSSV
jgi:hypothetical protein